MAVTATGVSKRFASYTHRPTSLKERALRHRVEQEDFWALRDVSAQIVSGQTVGLIGANGSGKSTLLKVLAGILQPTSGTVSVQGRTASLLELGAGFNGELTGRENVYLNASLLGLTRREVSGLFDQIVAFSELEEFIDGPVKHYSSGMYVRLGFAVAVHVDPDVLLVDEVLAVGDEAFAAKCMAKIAEFQQEGRTILFVSHALDVVTQICSRALVLNRGRLVHDGDPEQGVELLRATLTTDTGRGPATPTQLVQLDGVEVVDAAGREHHEAVPGDKVSVVVRLTADHPVRATVRVVVTGHFDLAMFVLEAPDVDLDGTACEVTFDIPALPALAGTFSLAVGVEECHTKLMLGAGRYPHRLHIRSDHGHGLLDVPQHWRVSPR